MNENLTFIFTPDGFCPDASDGDEYSAWMNDGGFSALYEAGLKAAPKTMSPSARFLYQTAASYFKQLTDLPELGIKTFFCSNVCAMYERETYLAQGGFPRRTIFN